jgi:hypothetical protein
MKRTRGSKVMDNSDSFEDPTVRNPFHGQVSVLEDYEEPGDWRVEYFDSDGGCYVTIFAGPEAEPRSGHATISRRSGANG